MPNLHPLWEFSPADWSDLAQGTGREWLVANGLGSYASSTLVGANTRRYHGLLVAALDPPMDRWVVLSKVEEELGHAGKVFPLSTNQYRDVVHPTGYQWLTRAALHPFPSFLYHVHGVLVRKEVFMVHHRQITVIRYEVLRAPVPVSLYLHLLVTSRPFHNLLRAGSKSFDVAGSAQHVAIRTRNREEKNGERRRNEGDLLWVASDRGYFYPDGQWYYNFQYFREKERGLDFEEDLFRPGCFTAKLREGESVALAASTEALAGIDPEGWRREEIRRLAAIRERLPIREVLRPLDGGTGGGEGEASHWVREHARVLEALAVTADTFVVRRGAPAGPAAGMSILAGYHWFADWGRDAFVALPGLTLVLGRHDDALAILRTFAKYCHLGLIPNAFLESSGRSPIYNTVDASLWFVNALYEYWRCTGDADGVRELYRFVAAILTAYEAGTAYGIKADENGLIWAGDPKTQLTWMDAKIGPWVVTPRHGAAVEVNALWYNALKVAEALAEPAGLLPQEELALGERAARVREAFLAHFWNPTERCLYDSLQPREGGGIDPDPSIRPNQIFAASLPFSMLSREEASDVVDRVWRDLYTPYGLRTLAPSHPNYKGQYQGDRWLRDGAYHQGTVWTWLMGPFITAYLNTRGRTDRTRGVVRELLSPLLAHLGDAGVGSVSEIFWGDFPHTPVGAISQAWSVAELLRVLIVEVLGYAPARHPSGREARGSSAGALVP